MANKTRLHWSNCSPFLLLFCKTYLCCLANKWDISNSFPLTTNVWKFAHFDRHYALWRRWCYIIQIINLYKTKPCQIEMHTTGRREYQVFCNWYPTVSRKYRSSKIWKDCTLSYLRWIELNLKLNWIEDEHKTS